MGGHVIKNASPVTLYNFNTILSNLKKIIPSTVNVYPIGSAGKKLISSDLDVLIDSAELISAFSCSNLKSAKNLLELRLQDYGYCTAKSGVSIHVGIPTGEDANIAQVDIMIVENAKIVAPLHTHDYSKDPNMKGGTLHAIWADLANLTSFNGTLSFVSSSGEEKPILMMSPYKGLVNRKTGELITANKDKIAKIIIDSCATSNDMSSTTNILLALQKDTIKYNKIKNKYFVN